MGGQEMIMNRKLKDTERFPLPEFLFFVSVGCL